MLIIQVERQAQHLATASLMVMVPDTTTLTPTGVRPGAGITTEIG